MLVAALNPTIRKIQLGVNNKSPLIKNHSFFVGFLSIEAAVHPDSDDVKLMLTMMRMISQSI